MHSSRISRRPQARSEATKAKILDAAQAMFSERGFENTQLDEVAARAGCSRGAIYAHYKNKEDLFLALMEHRVSVSFNECCRQIKEEPDRQQRRDLFKRWFVQQICGPQAGTLMLEFKLYAVRRPEILDKMLDLYNSLFKGADGELYEALFGEKMTRSRRDRMSRRFAVLGGALSALVLERKFRPALFSTSHLQELTEELFDTMVHA